MPTRDDRGPARPATKGVVARAPQGPTFPDSLCHSCAAPPRYVTSDRGAVFIHCPLLKRYPPQPVLSCIAYVRQSPPSDGA